MGGWARTLEERPVANCYSLTGCEWYRSYAVLMKPQVGRAAPEQGNSESLVVGGSTVQGLKGVLHWLENPWTSPSLTHQSHPFVLAPSLFRLPLVYFPYFPPHIVRLVRIYSLHIVWLRLLYTAPGRKSSHAPNLISMGGMFVAGRMNIKHAPNQETVGNRLKSFFHTLYIMTMQPKSYHFLLQIRRLSLCYDFSKATQYLQSGQAAV